MNKLYIDYNPFFVRAALLEDGRLVEYFVEKISNRGHLGNIYKGKVKNILSGMRAAFVDIGLSKNGFLYLGDSYGKDGHKLSPGDIIMCQVEKESFNAKGVRLTRNISVPGTYVVLSPSNNKHGVSRKIEDPVQRVVLEDTVQAVCPENMGFIVRSAASRVTLDEIVEDTKTLLETWEKIQKDYEKAQPCELVFRDADLVERLIRDGHCDQADWIVVDDPPLAEMMTARLTNTPVELYEGLRNIFKVYGIDSQMEKLSHKRVEMKDGGYIVIERTEALTVIDVNTGRYIGLKDLEDTVYQTNLNAAVEIARQLRLRDIGGIVIIDFIDMMEDGHRENVLNRLRSELKKDRRKTTALGMTSLGLVELTRKRTRVPTDGFIFEYCTESNSASMVSKGHLAIKLRDAMIEYTLSNDFKTMLVRAHPDICKEVLEAQVMAKELSRIWSGKHIYLLPDESLERDDHLIEDGNNKEMILSNEVIQLV